MNNTMLDRVQSYLARRRALGYRLKAEGGMLLNFAAYADRSGHVGPVTAWLALDWATLPRQAAPVYRARRLEVVRIFARHQAIVEPATEMPPTRILGSAHRRLRPHIFSADQVRCLMNRAGALRGPLAPATYRTLFGLLACSGLRVSEALALRIADVDLRAATVFVAQGKRNRSRLVPLHSSARAPMTAYALRRARLFPEASHFFVSNRGCRFSYSTARTIFRRLTDGMESNGARSRVRIHDLRHTFACRALTRIGRGRQAAPIVPLSNYMGHARAADTYWYLTALPELLADAARRFSAPAT